MWQTVKNALALYFLYRIFIRGSLVCISLNCMITSPIVQTNLINHLQPLSFKTESQNDSHLIYPLGRPFLNQSDHFAMDLFGK